MVLVFKCIELNWILFSGGIKLEHWPEMGHLYPNILSVQSICRSNLAILNLFGRSLSLGSIYFFWRYCWHDSHLIWLAERNIIAVVLKTICTDFKCLNLSWYIFSANLSESLETFPWILYKLRYDWAYPSIIEVSNFTFL